MAEGNILVYKLDELYGCSKKMGQVAEALERVKNLSASLKDGVSDYWQGKAYDAFNKRFADMNQAIDKLYQQIDSNKKKLDKAIELERQNEEDLTNNTVGRLSADNIF